MLPFLLVLFQVLSNPQVQFFDAFGSNELSKIDAVLSAMDAQQQNPDIQAYTGGLLMKKASFMKTPFQKLSMFRDGKKRLEEVIADYPNNVEYRIIRLVLQENAPEILKYNSNVEEDLSMIKRSFSNHSKVVQQFLLDYAKESKLLNETDLRKGENSK